MNMYLINNFLLIGSSMILFSIAIYCLLHRKVSGAPALFVQMIAGFLWTIGSYLEITSIELETKIFWRNVQQIGIYIIPISIVFFAVDYSKQLRLKKYIYMLAAVPITALVLILTNEFHHIMRSGYSTVANSVSASGESLVVHTTTVGLAFLSVNFFIPFLAIIILLDFSKKVASHFKKRVFLVIISILIRPLLSLIKATYLDPNQIYIPMAVMYVPSALILFYCVFKYGFFSLSPIARDKVFDIIREGIIVIDEEDKIIDKNPYAVTLVKKCLNISQELIGMNVLDVFMNNSEVYAELKKKRDSTIEVKLDVQSSSKYLSCNICILNIDNNKQVGAMLILNDITEKKYYELNLIEDADKDSLTQLFNRRGFMTHYGIVLEDAVEHSKPVSVIMIDIDHFKRINDSFGHIKGDKVLQNLAAILRDTLREEDIIGRIGGEEFAVVLPKINKNDAFIVAERIRRRVQEGGVLIQDDLTINYTVSIGVNDNTGTDTTIEQLLHNADMALYEAKKQSRNYTLVHDSYLLNQNEVV